MKLSVNVRENTANPEGEIQVHVTLRRVLRTKEGVCARLCCMMQTVEGVNAGL